MSHRQPKPNRRSFLRKAIAGAGATAAAAFGGAASAQQGSQNPATRSCGSSDSRAAGIRRRRNPRRR